LRTDLETAQHQLIETVKEKTVMEGMLAEAREVTEARAKEAVELKEKIALLELKVPKEKKESEKV